jgi:hypothetical protein
MSVWERCSFTSCGRPAGGGTYIDIIITHGERLQLRVCEEHWEAQRKVSPSPYPQYIEG